MIEKQQPCHQWLQEWLDQTGHKVLHLTKLLGLSQTPIYKVMTYKQAPSRLFAERVAAFLGIPLDAISDVPLQATRRVSKPRTKAKLYVRVTGDEQWVQAVRQWLKDQKHTNNTGHIKYTAIAANLNVSYKALSDLAAGRPGSIPDRVIYSLYKAGAIPPELMPIGNKPSWAAHASIFTDPKSLKDWFTEWLDYTGYSQGELARQLDLDSSTVSLILSGHRQPGRAVLKKVSQALSIPLSMIAEDIKYQKPTGNLLVSSVQAWFASQDMNTYQAATYIGISQVTLVAILNGKSQVPIRHVIDKLIAAGALSGEVAEWFATHKFCHKCHQWKALTAEYWYGALDKPERVYKQCKECISSHFKYKYNNDPEFKQKQKIYYERWRNKR